MSNKNTYRSTVISVAVMAGFLYFGYMMLVRQSKDATDSPYEYNIDKYKDVNPELLDYSEQAAISIDAQTFNALSVDSSDYIFAAVDSRIIIIKPDGVMSGNIELVSPATAIAVKEDGRLFAALKDHIEVYDNSGKKIDTWAGLGERAHITSIAFIEKDLLVADYGSRSIWRFKPDGGLKENKIGGFTVPSPYFDVATVHDGSIWIVNPGEARLENYTAKHLKKKSWGVSGMEIEGFSGCCNPSHIALIDDGSFVTAEKGLPRVKVYSKAGKLISVVAEPKAFNNTVLGCDGEALIKDIAVDSHGRVLVLDRGKQSIRIFEKND